MNGRCLRGGRTERLSSRVMEDEKGLSHDQSLNHLDSPLVLLGCGSGGVCTVGWKDGRCRSLNEGSFGTYLAGPETSSPEEESETGEEEKMTKTRATKTMMVIRAVLR